MADFFNQGWSWFIAIISLVGIVGYGLVAFITIKHQKSSGDHTETTGHVWDGNLAEYDTPIPKWWMGMLLLSIVFSLVYLLLYPGLGSFKGLLGWSQTEQYNQEVDKADQLYSPLFSQFSGQDLVTLAKDEKALKTGKRLYQTNCAVCHGSDARGAKSFPNLRDAEWLYGGDAETIKASILNGRNGVMPGWDQVLGENGSRAVAEYVLSFTREPANPRMLEDGKKNYDQLCVSCHGVNGEGNQALGAPNLTDDVWLYGDSYQAVIESIRNGRNGIMPAHDKILGEDKVHILAAYIYSLSQDSNSQ